MQHSKYLIFVGVIIIFLLCHGLFKSTRVQKIKQMKSPPPLLTDSIRVYVSAPLFKMSDLFYGIGINGLTSTEPGGVTSDNIDYDYINELADIYSTTMGIPKGGMAEALAVRGLSAYIPARDGFNMAVLIGGTMTYLGELLSAGDEKTKKLEDLGVVGSDAGMAGAYLLMAVYAFDMYNLVSRCNCCIFNTNGLAMDDGSVSELGIASTRGIPTSIHAPEDFTLFAGGIINPMVAGASSIDLSIPSWKTFNIEDAIDDLLNKIKTQFSDKTPQYSHYAGVPKQIDFWNSLGEKIWLMRYKTKNSHVVGIDGRTDQVKSYTNMYLLNMGSAKGQGYIGSTVVGLVKSTQKEFGLPYLSPINTMA